MTHGVTFSAVNCVGEVSRESMSSNYTNGILNGWLLSEEKSKVDVFKFVLFE